MPTGLTRAILLLPVLTGCYQFATDSPEERSAATRGDRRSVDVAPGTDVNANANDDLTPEILPRPTRPTGPPDVAAQPEPSEPRWILARDLVNARDLGGTPVRSGGSVAYGAFFRGPPLASLSPDGCAEFDELGIRTVLDLRVESERASKPESKCVHEAADVVSTPFPVPYNVSPQDYIAILDTTASIRAFFEKLGDEAAYPIYLHCTWGRDRTGVLAAVILRALGSSREDILREYMLSQPSVGAYPRSLEAALDAIEDDGGIEAYLAAAGVTDDQLSALRSRGLATNSDPAR